jgi:hypothetical protein
MRSLFRALGITFIEDDLSPYNSRLNHFFLTVQTLIDAGLLRADDPTMLGDTKIEATQLVSKILTPLHLSLRFLASYEPYQSMLVKPLFGVVPEVLFGVPEVSGPPVKRLDVFVLMPFKHDMLPVYEDHIKPTCANMELTVRRADDFFTVDSVVRDVWKAITVARLIVADCTDRNPNVFYEIGLAHAIGKPTILLTQREEDFHSTYGTCVTLLTS